MASSGGCPARVYIEATPGADFEPLGAWALGCAARPLRPKGRAKGKPGARSLGPGFLSLELQNVAARLRTCRATPSVVSAVADPSEHIEQVEFERVGLSAINRAAAAMAMHTSRRSAHLRTPLDDSRALLFIGAHGRPPQT
jgi:hypothetical protein